LESGDLTVGIARMLSLVISSKKALVYQFPDLRGLGFRVVSRGYPDGLSVASHPSENIPEG
jgi:hypothetical protein